MTLDGDKGQRGTSQIEDSSTGKPSQTSTKTSETFTKEQVDKMVSDRLAATGREAKSLTDLKKQVEDGMATFHAEKTAWEKQKEEAELERIKDDPDELKRYRAEQKQKAGESELANEKKKLASERQTLETEKTAHAEALEQLRIIDRTQLASEIATEKGVSFDAIYKLAKDDSREAMEAVAELLPKTKEEFTPDSGRTSGGGTDLDSLSPREKIDKGIEEAKKKKK